MTRSIPKLAAALWLVSGAWANGAHAQQPSAEGAQTAGAAQPEAPAADAAPQAPAAASAGTATEAAAPATPSADGEAVAPASEPTAAPPAPAAAAPEQAAPAQRTTWTPTQPPPVIVPAEVPPPPAKDGRFVLAASFTPRWNSDPSYDFFADDDVTMAYGLWLGYDVLRFADRFALAAELGWSTEYTEQSGLAGGVLDTELRTCAWELSADLRWEASKVLWPHVRFGGGLIKDKLHLDARGDGDFEDTGLSGTFSAGLGATLKTPAGLFRTSSGALSSLSLGVRVEAGYRVMAPTAVSLTPEEETDDASIPVSLSDLGEVSRSGPYVAISLVGRI